MMNNALNVEQSTLKNRLLSATLATTLVASSFAFQPATAEAAPVYNNQVSIACNNASTDAADINAAIAGTTIKSEVIFRGTCLINQPIKLLGDRSYRGESKSGTVLKQANGANLDGVLVAAGYLNKTINADAPISIRDLTIDGNKANNAGKKTSGIILRAWNSVVNNLYIENMGGSGIRLTNQSVDPAISIKNDDSVPDDQRHTMVNGSISGNMIESSGEYGIYVEDSSNVITDWQVNDNWIGDSGLDGIHLDNAAGWFVERNHIYDVKKNAISADRMFGTAINDNYIEGFGEDMSAAGTYGGIVATVQGEDTINGSTEIGGATGSTITNNRVFRMGNRHNEYGNAGSKFNFISIDRVKYSTGVVNVNGNLIRGRNLPSDTGLNYASGGNKLLVLSVDNLVTNVASGKQRVVGAGVTLATGY